MKRRNLYRILGHPVRIRIIEMLGEKGRLGFTDFKRDLPIPTGTIYYHFEVLRGLITQDKDRKYRLTDLGLEAYHTIRSKGYEDFYRKASTMIPSRPSLKVTLFKNIFVPTEFFQLIYARFLVSLIGGVLIVSFGALIIPQAQLKPLLFFFNQTSDPQISIILQFLFSWLAIFGLSDILTTGLFKRRGEDLHLLFGTAFSLLPLLIFPSIKYLDILLGLTLPLFHDVFLTRVFLSLLQGWSLAILTSAISQFKGVRMERAAFVALLVAYINILILYILGSSI